MSYMDIHQLKPLHPLRLDLLPSRYVCIPAGESQLIAIFVWSLQDLSRNGFESPRTSSER